MSKPQIDRRQGTTGVWLNRQTLIASILASIIISLVVSIATVLSVQGQTNSSFRTVSVNACDGANLIRGVARLLLHDWKPQPPSNRSDQLLRIRDCEATYDRKRIVIAEEDVELEYLRRLSEGTRVAIRNGGELVPIP